MKNRAGFPDFLEILPRFSRPVVAVQHIASAQFMLRFIFLQGYITSGNIMMRAPVTGRQQHKFLSRLPAGVVMATGGIVSKKTLLLESGDARWKLGGEESSAEQSLKYLLVYQIFLPKLFNLCPWSNSYLPAE